MGCFPQNKVQPFGVPSMSPPKRKKSIKARLSKRSKGYWRMFTAFVTGLLCTRGSGTEVIPFQTSPIDDDSDSDSGTPTPPTTPPPRPRRKFAFEEKVFTMPTEETQATSAKLTVPITDLPKPNECHAPQDLRTNTEILKEFRAHGLVGEDHTAAVVGENVAKGGMAFEIRLTTVRPKTAKGMRVPKPPRRLESLKVEAAKGGQLSKSVAEKIKSKQEKAAKKRQALMDSRTQKTEVVSRKHKRVADIIAMATEQKKQDLTEKLDLKAERAKSARLSYLEDRRRRADLKNRRRELARKSKQLSLGGSGMLLSPSVSPISDCDRISTYNGSSGSEDSLPQFFETVDYLHPIEEVQPEQDDFYDAPLPGAVPE